MCYVLENRLLKESEMIDFAIRPFLSSARSTPAPWLWPTFRQAGASAATGISPSSVVCAHRRRRTCWLCRQPLILSLPLSIMFLLLMSQRIMCLSHQALLTMEPANSIFGSLLGSSDTNATTTTTTTTNSNSNSNSNNNENTAAQQTSRSAADLHQAYKNGQASDKVSLPGDILLGGLFPIHMKGTKVECGEINRDRGIQRLEAMLYALDRINEDSKLLPGIKLGAILLDSCSSSIYALNQSLEFIRASINTVESSAFECKDKSAPRPKYGSKMIAGVVGGSYSEVSLQVANLLRLFRIPQVSYASTGTALSDKTLYDLFARTVPSDMFQARAIADIVLKLNWSYVSLVSSEGLYGDSGSKEFMKQASVRRICIATHEKVSPTTDGNAFDSIVANLLKRNATGVVLFTRAEDTGELLLAVKRAKLFHNFAWVAADGWGTHQKLIEGVEEVAWGAITVELSAKAIPGFDQYMKELTPWDNQRNPWFCEHWQEWFNCQLQTNLVQQQQVASGAYAGQADSWPPPPVDYGHSDLETDQKRRRSLPEACQNGTCRSQRFKRATAESKLKQFCSPNLRISESNGYRQEQKVQFVVDAVYAMAHALHKAWYKLCDAQPGVVCEALKELNGGDFYTKYLLNVSFKDLAGSEVKFDERGDGLGRYNIYNFRQVRSNQLPNLLINDSFIGGQLDGSFNESVGPLKHLYTNNDEFEYSLIGRWTEKDYYLQLEDTQFIQGESMIPESYCSRPCELGQAKIMRAGDHCCWICKTCAPYEFLPDEFSCLDCGIGRWPVPNKTSCYDLPQKYLRWDSVFSLISLTIACLGIALTLFVSLIFTKYLDTPVVKASGRELSFILLAGIAFCHLSTFVLLSKPTPFICGSQRFLVNFGFSLMYASLLVKTNRISRIFNCARKSAKRPSFISPKSQMLITGILVAIQIFLTIVWFLFEPPGIRSDSPEGKRDEVILKCRAKGKSFIISLVYNMILITTCTVYAVKTRKIPENFNESKFIGFTMYTTIVIWLAFVTMFFGTNNSYEIQMNTMCVCISLSAYVTLFCLFSPKVSIILLHPDKNVRKLTMNSATYKRPFKPVSSLASVDGRHTAAIMTDAVSAGPMSTTSNVLNLAESQAIRLQESSVISNVVNSNSLGSNCSNSQKTASNLSQRLTLLGTCANCGAHQLTQAASLSAEQSASKLLSSSQVTSSEFKSVSRPSSSSQPIVGGIQHQQQLTQQIRSSETNKGALGRSSILLAASSRAIHSPVCAAKVVHKIAVGRLQQTKRIASDDLLLGEPARNSKVQAHNRHQQHMTSLNRLNELTSTSSERQCIDESISSLANDSFVNTSKENTPNHPPLGPSSRLQQQCSQQVNGSDSIIWNQSVYSIDYCSDCCPSSYCHCSCPACSSSNGGPENILTDTNSQHHHHHDNEMDDYDIICDSLPLQDDCPLEVEQLASTTRRRRSEEQTRATPLVGLSTVKTYHSAQPKMSQRQEGACVPLVTARRSQTMEMRTIESLPATSRAQHEEELGRANPKAAPIVYALQAAANSAMSACTGSQVPQSNKQELHYVQITSNKDKFSETTRKKEQFTDKSRHSKSSDTALRVHPGNQQLIDSPSSGSSRIHSEVVKRSAHFHRKGSNLELLCQAQHRKSSCYSYQDDSCEQPDVGQSNSDSDSCYYYDEDTHLDHQLVTRSAEPIVEPTYDDDDDNDDDDDDADDDDNDFDHDGRVSLNRRHQTSERVTKRKRTNSTKQQRVGLSNMDTITRPDEQRMSSMIVANLGAARGTVESVRSSSSIQSMVVKSDLDNNNQQQNDIEHHR